MKETLIATTRRSLLFSPLILISVAHGRGHAGLESFYIQALETERREEKRRKLHYSLNQLRRYEWTTNGKLVMVNIASQKLVAWRNGEVVEEMRVIVGRPRTRTPIRGDEMIEVFPNPTWTPPASILAEPLWRNRIRDAAWLQRYGFTRQGGRLVQSPGPRNVLGRVKFRLAAGDAIYMHDTNERHLFGGENRLLSHGCIRLERPEDFMAFSLDMSREDVENIIRSGRRNGIQPNRRIPVLLAYLPAFPRHDGVMEYYGDPYSKMGRGLPQRTSTRLQENDHEEKPTW